LFESINPPGAALHGPRQSSQQPLPVLIIAHDVLPAVAAGHEVVDRVGILDTQSAWHANTGNIPADPKQKKNLKAGLTQSPSDCNELGYTLSRDAREAVQISKRSPNLQPP